MIDYIYSIVENLNKYKIELEILRDEKDSAEKAAILRTQELQVEIAVFLFTNRKKKSLAY